MRVRRTALLAAVLAVGGLLVAAPASATAAPPDITSLSTHTVPTKAFTDIEVYGQRLNDVTSVRIGSVYASPFRTISDHHISVTTPYFTTPGRTHLVVYTGDHGQSSWSDPQAVVDIGPLPSVLALKPNVAPASGGRTIMMYGHNFEGVRGVLINGKAASRVTPLGPTTLTFWLPSGFGGLAGVQLVDAYGMSNAVHFRYVDRPVVSHVENAVTQSAGTTSAVYGIHLSEVLTLSVGGVVAHRIAPSDDSMISFVVPPHAPGTVHIQVTTIGGTSTPTNDDRFTYLGPNPDSWTSGRRVLQRGLMQGVSCPTTSFCTAVSPTELYTLNNGTWTVSVSGPFTSVSCASVSFCLAGTVNGTWRFDGSSWAALSGAPAVRSVSCPDASTCWAVTSSGALVHYDSGAGWGDPDPTAGLERRVTCASPSFCVAVASSDKVVTYDGTTWSSSSVDAGRMLVDASCASVALCAAVDDIGRAVTWDGTRWSAPTPVFAQDGGQQVSCAGSVCTAMSTFGRPARYENGHWSVGTNPVVPFQENLRGAQGYIRGLSCASATTCVAVDDSGRAISYDGVSWSTPQPAFLDAAPMFAVACPTTDWCAASDPDGNVVTGSGTNWVNAGRVLNVGGAAVAVSCSSASFCMVVSAQSTPAVFDGTSWHSIDGPEASAVSCVSPTRCVTPTSAYDGTRWNALSLPAAFVPSGLSCWGVTLCVLTGGGFATTLAGTRWTAPVHFDPQASEGAADVSCTSATACVAVDGYGTTSTYDGHAWGAPMRVSSTFNFGRAQVDCSGTWCAATFAGAGPQVRDADGWSASAPFFDVNGISCAAPDRCVAATYGGLMVTTAP